MQRCFFSRIRLFFAMTNVLRLTRMGDSLLKNRDETEGCCGNLAGGLCLAMPLTQTKLLYTD